MTENSGEKTVNNQSNEVKLPCGCIYQDKGWMLTRVAECEYHHRKRTTKRPYRPKAECVRP
ncbi:MAG: hypothetical protein PHY74_04625 [Candidatus Bathyarchaeota archaeon]|nr:hypothetical protein [Candidatus Bathyarchaeota archaeon]MDD4325942.1 hypothetical protein [Candidatus Bathyarchaeota archaeon]MDI9576831.1 hypothetical protein [Thermoproteota archaeon]NLD66403.1 hypothetical protein [Thermoproteota archaeon]